MLNSDDANAGGSAATSSSGNGGGMTSGSDVGGGGGGGDDFSSTIPLYEDYEDAEYEDESDEGGFGNVNQKYNSLRPRPKLTPETYPPVYCMYFFIHNYNHHLAKFNI